MPNPKVTTSTFQVTDDLDNETVIAEYLSSAAQDENPDVLLKALGDVAKVLRHGTSSKDQCPATKASTKPSAPARSRGMKRLRR